MHDEAFDVLMKRHSDRQCCGSLSLKDLVISRFLRRALSRALEVIKERGGLDIQQEVLTHHSEVDMMSMVSAAISFCMEMADLTSKRLLSLIDSVSSSSILLAYVAECQCEKLGKLLTIKS